MKLVFTGHGLPVGPYVVITDRAWRSDQAAAMDACRRAPAGRCSSSRPAPARAWASRGSTSPAALHGGHRGGARARPQGRRRGRRSSAARSSARVLQGRGTAAPRSLHVGEIAVHGARVLRLRGQVPRRGRVRPVLPGQPARGGLRRGAAAGRRGVRGAGCEGLARVDFFYTENGDVVINEINTMPGFTPTRCTRGCGPPSGLGYPELIDELSARPDPPDRPALTRVTPTAQPLQRRSPWGTACAARVNAPEQQRLGAVVAGHQDLDRGRPAVVVKRTPSLSRWATQSTPLTVTRGVGRWAAVRPQRAITGGSPQACTAGAAGEGPRWPCHRRWWPRGDGGAAAASAEARSPPPPRSRRRAGARARRGPSGCARTARSPDRRAPPRSGGGAQSERAAVLRWWWLRGGRPGRSASG